MLRAVEIGESQRERLNAWVESSPLADFRQMYEWGELRARTGWTPRRFLLMEQGDLVGSAALLVGRLPHLPFTLLSVPYGPIADYRSAEVVTACADLLRGVAREVGADFVRVDPALPEDDHAARAQLARTGFLANDLPWSHWNGPRETVRLDITPPEDALLRGLSKSKRYGIGLFQRKGYTVTPSDQLADLLIFRQLLLGVAAHRGFLVRDEEYWRALWSEFVLRERATLLLARDGDRLLGGTFLVVCGPICHFWYAADDPEAGKRSERPNDALYWASIQYARSRGCRIFDMMGVVSESHLHYKLSFGAHVFRSLGYHDLVLHPTRHRLFCAAEKHALPRAVRLVARLQALKQRRPSTLSAADSPPAPAEAVAPGAKDRT